jgi:phosphoglycerate kinase
VVQRSAFVDQLGTVLSKNGPLDDLPLEALLAGIPEVRDLQHEPFRSTVLIRFDLDVPLRDGQVVDMSRIEAGAPTIKHCLERGWKVVLLGHLGRDAAASAAPVCAAMSDSLGVPIAFIGDWLDEEESRLTGEVSSRVREAPPRSVFMLQNARKYAVEQALWEARSEDLPAVADRLYAIALSIRENLTDTEVNEAIAASNLDFSSSVVPLLMAQTGMGLFMNAEMKIHIPAVRRARLVVFSGLKMDKLNDLEQVLTSRPLALVIVAGALAMPLKKAAAELAGACFSAGKVETDTAQKGYVQPQRLEQARRIVAGCRQRGVELVLPCDFVLDNGESSEQIPPDRVQMDIGPRSLALFKERVRAFMAEAARAPETSTMFFNGVFGKFEDPRFEAGTRGFIPILKEMTEAGIATYVGGGEGRAALLKYGSLDDVTHAFTAGGTVLKCLANRHIGYLKAMYLQNQRL